MVTQRVIRGVLTQTESQSLFRAITKASGALATFLSGLLALQCSLGSPQTSKLLGKSRQTELLEYLPLEADIRMWVTSNSDF